MSSNLKKRIVTSILLISLLIGMFFYSYIMIVSLIIISIITWIEFYALISKIIKTKYDKYNKDVALRINLKAILL